MIPGDPARVMAGTDADEAGLEEIRQKYGLNDPVPSSTSAGSGLALRGDLGESIRTRGARDSDGGAEAADHPRAGRPLVLVALLIAIPVGVLAAVRRNTVWDYLASGLSLCGLSVPNFWLGIMLILFLSVRLGWLPASGFVPLFEDPVGEPSA